MRIPLTLFALLLSATFVHAQITQSYRTEYFAGLPFWESPMQPFKGGHPLSKKEALERIHLRLEYDNQNRIVEASVRIGEELKEFEGFFGNLYINAPITRVNYSGITETHNFFDRFGSRIAVMGAVWEKVYTKDRYGRNIRLQFKNKDSEFVTDNFENVVYEWTHLMDGGVVEVRKNKDGKLTPLRGDFEFLRTKISYGADGHVNALHNIDEQGHLVNAPCGAATLRYFYDPFGRFDRWEVYDKEGKSAKGPSHTNGEQNVFNGYYLSDIVFFNESGGPATHWSGVERWNFQYDRFGNITQLNFQNAEGKAKGQSNGYASIRFEWTPDGRYLISQSYHDVTGKQMLHPTSGVAKTLNIRNTKGLIVETRYLDENNKLKNRKDNGVASIRYEYDRASALIATTRLNVSGQTIGNN